MAVFHRPSTRRALENPDRRTVFQSPFHREFDDIRLRVQESCLARTGFRGVCHDMVIVLALETGLAEIICGQ